ncbi:MAG: hypothetical protein DHS20C04_17750 [Hyphococcus sp.]|nr:MAG: hypothetical protein DHS20C04_17750 [Marinicaulis sp.]
MSCAAAVPTASIAEAAAIPATLMKILFIAPPGPFPVSLMARLASRPEAGKSGRGGGPPSFRVR